MNIGLTDFTASHVNQTISQSILLLVWIHQSSFINSSVMPSWRRCNSSTGSILTLHYTDLLVPLSWAGRRGDATWHRTQTWEHLKDRMTVSFLCLCLGLRQSKETQQKTQLQIPHGDMTGCSANAALWSIGSLQCFNVTFRRRHSLLKWYLTLYRAVLYAFVSTLYS